METKICTVCKENKPFSNYDTHKLGKFGLNPVCKPCRLVRQRKHRKDNGYNAQIKYKYGITYKQFEELKQKQGNLCATCGIELDQNNIHSTKSVIDHCHTTNKVRGVLCWSCNVALGLVRDNKDTLTNMIGYLNANSTS